MEFLPRPSRSDAYPQESRARAVETSTLGLSFFATRRLSQLRRRRQDRCRRLTGAQFDDGLSNASCAPLLERVERLFCLSRRSLRRSHLCLGLGLLLIR